MPRPTLMDLRIAEALRRAQGFSAGYVVCPRCHDAEDVLCVKFAQPSPDGLRQYRCRACAYRFSDLTGTPMAFTKIPLRVWAQVARCMAIYQRVQLCPGYARLTMNQRRTVHRMQAVLAQSDMATRWAMELGEQGFRGGAFSPEPVPAPARRRKRHGLARL